MYIKKLLRNHQIPPDLVVKQAHFAFRDNPGKDSYLPFCDFYTYDDKLNVGQCFQSVEHVLFNEGTDDFSWIATEREKQIVLLTSRLMRVRRVRLLRSIRCVKILPVRYFSFGTSLAQLPQSSRPPCRYRTESTGLTIPDRPHHSVARKCKPTHRQFQCSTHTRASVVAPCCQRSSTAHQVHR